MGHFLSLWWSKSSSSSPISLYHQPLDIIQIICHHLEPESAVALALTCKGFYQHFSQSAFSRLRQADHSQRKAIIELIERDIGHRFHYCALCDDFHRWSSSWGPVQTSQDAYSENIPACSRPTGRGCGLRPFRACMSDSPQDITYAHCQLVMNCHFHGPSRGLPLGSLEVGEHDTCVTNLLMPVRPRGCASDHIRSWEARIIYDELYVSCSLTVREFGPVLASWSEFRRKSQGMTEYILGKLCDHGPRQPGMARPGRGMFWTTFPGKIRLYSSRDADPWASVMARGSCRYCFTDYEATIYFRGTKACTARITSYHQLGSFRSIRDWRWINAFHCPSRVWPDPEVYVRHAELGFAPDYVRRRWIAHPTSCTLTPLLSQGKPGGFGS